MKRMTTLISLAVLASVLLAGCNTIKGAGKDVQKVGEAVETNGRLRRPFECWNQGIAQRQPLGGSATNPFGNARGPSPVIGW